MAKMNTINVDITPNIKVEALERIADAMERFLELIDTPSVTRHDARTIIGECAGFVSACWEPLPNGVFDSTSAADAVDAAVAAIYDGGARMAMSEESNDINGKV